MTPIGQNVRYGRPVGLRDGESFVASGRSEEICVSVYSVVLVSRCRSRRRFLAASAALLGSALAGCGLRRPSGDATVRVANLTDERQRLSVRVLRDGDLVWTLSVELPAREPNDSAVAEATNALQSVEEGERFTVAASVDGADRVHRGSLTIDCVDDAERDDLVVIRLLPNGGGVYPDIRERDCGHSR